MQARKRVGSAEMSYEINHKITWIPRAHPCTISRGFFFLFSGTLRRAMDI